MRARNLKPSIFKNELLAVANPLFTLVFEGLWCLADRAGRLEDKPAKIHLNVNPGRAMSGTAKALAWLSESGFIHRYTANGIKYIQVLNFLRHQNPHCKEPASTIPAPCEPDAETGVAVLTPESPFLTPESPFLIPDSPTATTRPSSGVIPSEFVEFQILYPKRGGGNPWGRALKAIRARLREGHSWEEIMAGTCRYHEFIRATGKERTEFVMQAATFCGPDKRFLEPWDLPATKAEARQDQRADAARDWMALEGDNAGH